jgi:hypothetical protein
MIFGSVACTCTVFIKTPTRPDSAVESIYAGREICLRCCFEFSDHSAVCFVYRCVIYMKARFQIIIPKLPNPAPRGIQIIVT